MKKQFGIWIDLREAWLLPYPEESKPLVCIEAKEIGHVKGGSGTAVPWGPQDAVSESKYLEKRRHRLQRYFDEIALALLAQGQPETIVITGPAETKKELERNLEGRYEFRQVKLHSLPADKMTENQLRALIRDFYQTQPKD